MDEASSKFVDQMVMEKLLSEKLEKVQHLPTHTAGEVPHSMFEDFYSLLPKGDVDAHTEEEIRIQSPIRCAHPENQKTMLKHYPAEESKGTVLLTHGLFEDNRDIYGFLIKGLNEKGLSVYLNTLPFHYERVPKESSFSGEYFWSANIIRTQQAFKQAVYELYQSYSYLSYQSNNPIYLAGFSMGASVTLTLSALWDKKVPLFAVNPASGLSDIVWDSPLCRTIKRDYLAGGYRMEDLHQIYRSFEPKSLQVHSSATDAICLAYALYDQVTEQYQYDNLIKSWNIQNTIAYKAGHLNTLRVPRLANDMATFFIQKEEL